jgi:hypothetical protein
MKKSLLFSVALLMATFVYSQRVVDIGISMTSPTTTSSIRTGKPFSINLTVTNNGPGIIKTKDTFYFFRGVGNTIDYQSATIIPITSNINSGGSANYTINNMVITGSSGGQFTLCSYLILYNGNIADSVYDMNIDGNNRSCATMSFSGAGVDALNANAFTSKAYPNPVSGVLNIEFIASNNTNSIIEIFDMQGRTVQTVNNGIVDAGLQTVAIDVAHLSKGVYFYKVINGSEISMNKFIVE